MSRCRSDRSVNSEAKSLVPPRLSRAASGDCADDAVLAGTAPSALFQFRRLVRSFLPQWIDPRGRAEKDNKSPTHGPRGAFFDHWPSAWSFLADVIAAFAVFLILFCGLFLGVLYQ